MPRFNTIFLEQADEFFESLDVKVKAKILFNIEKAEKVRKYYFENQ